MIKPFLDEVLGLFSADASSSLQATITPTDQELRVDQFVDPGPTPGNVAVCFCGGGSRAMTAGMGQMRALKHLTTPDGENLLGQARLMATVSGGSWLGVPFQFLTPETSDDDYLNRYVDDPGRLVVEETAGHSIQETLDQLPEGNIGQHIATPLFGPAGLAIEVLLLHEFGKVPLPMLWQTLIALHFLRPYDLYKRGKDFAPTTFFSYDERTREDILRVNPKLSREQVELIAASGTRSRRPFLSCQMAMFVTEPKQNFELLAPVQATPFTFGIFGCPTGRDANGRRPGGGGVTPLAFSSTLSDVQGCEVTLTQQRQCALLDIVGTSSAFYAELLNNFRAEWEKDKEDFFRQVEEAHQHLDEWVGNTLPDGLTKDFLALVDRELLDQMKEHQSERHAFVSKLLKELEKVTNFVPEYTYWPVKDAKPADAPRPTRFADGGDLENTGVASSLAYEDIDNVVSFINSGTAMGACSNGVMNKDGEEIPGTRVYIDGQIPPLFGYQPYVDGKGYVLYEGDENPDDPIHQHNQVFPSDKFAELIRGFWAASGNSTDPASLKATGTESIPGVNQRPVILKQHLEVVDNTWFGVRGGRSVGVLWCYTNRAQAWNDLLTEDVREILGDFKDPASYHGFPHYSTFQTHLTEVELNLFAHFTAWCVGNKDNRQAFVDMFA